MNDNQTYIISLCQQLARKQKTPSVALIKSISERKLAMPEIIQVLKRWKESGGQLEAPDATDTNQGVSSPESLEARVEKLEQQVAMLTRLLQKG